ncbi:MAG: hypothetical protein VKS61_04890 [Candidatus Sericytochromatia bacterium]|nr:hypothetical protein [Candidatus Sericytochromatia bacterium]MEB3221394.1 hypothetical protein [Candidatus Sericytochromatia bacterium]
MRWKLDALIETRFEGPDDEVRARKIVQAELWRLIEGLEAALGNQLGTSVTVLACEPLADEAEGG